MTIEYKGEADETLSLWDGYVWPWCSVPMVLVQLKTVLVWLVLMVIWRWCKAMLLYVTKVKLTGQPSCWNIQLDLFNLQKEIDFPSKLQKKSASIRGSHSKDGLYVQHTQPTQHIRRFSGGVFSQSRLIPFWSTLELIPIITDPCTWPWCTQSFWVMWPQ